MSRLDLCFLAWRESPRMLERFHASVAAALPPGWDGTVVLVENAAPAATSAAARALVGRFYPAARRVVLRAPRNLGYARAMDLALAECSAEYVALLNSDGRVTPGMLDVLVDALDLRPGALWAAPSVHGPGERCEPPGPPFAESALAGTALVVRREPFLALGAFDPLYFFYNEDYDASRRIRDAGWELLRVPHARFEHGKGGRSRRGVFLRELFYAATAQTLAAQHDPDLPGLLRRRARSLADHARAGNVPALGGIGLASLGLPVSLALAADRRRRPWDGERLRYWLAANQPRLARTELGGGYSVGAATPTPTGHETPVPPRPQ